MQKGFSTKAIIVIVVVLLVLGGGWFVMHLNSQTPSSTELHETSQAPQKIAEQKTIHGTYFDLLKAGGSIECEWKPNASSLQPAHIWASGGKARSTVMTTEKAAGEVVEANAIFRDNKMYSWVKLNDMAPVGFMMNQDEIKNVAQNLTPQQRQQAEQYQQKISFNCKPWVPDESKFVPPSDVQFRQQ